MGRFSYGSQVAVEFEDRILAHLQVVISAKLRRGESLLFSWRDSEDAGHGRTTIWLHPRADVAFTSYDHRKPAINGAWVEALMLEANKPAGLQVIPEPGLDEAPVGHRNTVTASGRR